MRQIHSHFRKLALVTALVLIATPLLAQGGPGPRPGHFRGGGPHGAMVQRLLERLDLSDDQREQIDQLMADHRSAMQDRHELMRTLRQQLMERIHDEEFDEAAIRDAARAVADVQADIAVEQARLRQQIHALLTPEQLAKVQEMREKRQELMKQRRGAPGERGFHHHGGPGPWQDFDE